MKGRISRLVDSVLVLLPTKYHRPIKLFNSEKKMLEYAAIRMRVGNWREAKKILYETSTEEGYLKVEKSLPRRYQIKVTNSILGLAFKDEVLLNCYALNKESDNVIKYTILHELGHANDKKEDASIEASERRADKFALNWLV